VLTTLLADRTWVAADAFALFRVVMEAANPWYEWQEPANNQKKKSPEDGLHPYAAPVVAICNRIQNQYLSNVDPTLWRRMSELGIEPQLYGM
jgi:TBC1 domain family member 5